MELVKTLTQIVGRSKKANVRPAVKKKKSDKTFMDFDLLYQLSYMSVIAAAGVPRSLIFEHSGEVTGGAGEYFKKVELAHHRLQYDYAKACRIIGEATKDDDMKGLLLRFSNSLLSGEPEADFLSREAEMLGESYKNAYGEKLETLKLWTDAYVSLSLSAVLIIIIGMVSTMIYKISNGFIFGMVALSIGVTGMGIWLIYLMCPREVVVLRVPGSREQKIVAKMMTILLPAALVFGVVAVVLGHSMGYAFVAIGVLIFPIGHFACKDDAHVIKRDIMIGQFLASLGGVCTAIGTTVREALGRLDLDAIDVLMNEVKRLHNRLVSGIRPRLAWARLVEETGSELVGRSVGMFYDAIDIGGEPKAAGYHASLFASKIAMLRAKRKTISSPFRWLCIAMHASIVVLLVFVTEVISIFGGMIGKASQGMSAGTGTGSVPAFASFNFSGLEMMHGMVVPLVLIFTVANAVAPAIADGGAKSKLFFNLGITATISGGALIVLPKIAAALFVSVPA